MSTVEAMSVPTTSALTNPRDFGKRKNEDPDDVGQPPMSIPRRSVWYYVLESESDRPSEEDTESIHSIQDKVTDSAKDTPDISSEEDIFATANTVYRQGRDGRWFLSIGGSSRIQERFPVEFEPATVSETEMKHPFTMYEAFSSSDSDVQKSMLLVKEGVQLKTCTSLSSTSDTPDKIDPELSLTDYWYCVQCKSQNNNPLFRYCEKCYGDRKNFFPPRPKPRKNRKKKRASRKTKKNESGGAKSIDDSWQTGTVNSSSGVSSQSLPSEASCSQSGSQSTQKLESETESSFSNSQNAVNSSSNVSDLTSVGRIRLCDSSKSVQSGESSLNTSKVLHGESSASTLSSSNMCASCMSRPKDGLFIHTKIVHRYSCYQCSKKIWREIGRCPLCNLKVSSVKKLLD